MPWKMANVEENYGKIRAKSYMGRYERMWGNTGNLLGENMGKYGEDMRNLLGENMGKI